MGLLDKQRESIISASKARSSALRERDLRNTRPRFRNSTEAKDKSYRFRPEYGWVMNDEGLLAEQGRKGKYDETVDNYSGEITKAKSGLLSSVNTARGKVNTAYSDAEVDLAKQFSDATAQNEKAFSGAINKTKKSAPTMHTVTSFDGKSSFNVADVAAFKKYTRWLDPKHGYDGLVDEDDTPQFNSRLANRYMDAQKKQIAQSRSAGIDSLRKQWAASKASLSSQRTTAFANLSSEKATALKNFDKQAAAKVASYQKEWDTTLNELKGMYGKSVKAGAAKYEEMKNRYSNSITGEDPTMGSAASGATAEEIKQWGVDPAKITNEDLAAQMESAKKSGNERLMQYLMQIATTRTEGNNAEEKVQQ